MNLKYLLKFIHGEKPTTVTLFMVHVLPFICAYLYVQLNFEMFVNLTGLQLVLYYLFAWELLGGVIALLSKSTKLFWLTQPIKHRLIYVFIHAIHPVIWLLFLKVDIRFGILYFLFVALSTIFLLKVIDKWLLVTAILVTLAGLLICYEIGLKFNPFPFGFEWIPFLYFIKLLFAFTIKSKE